MARVVGLTTALLLLLVALAPPAAARSNTHEVPDDLAPYIPCIRQVVRRFGKARVNHVYIARAVNDDGREHLYAYWKEDQSILLVDHFFGDCSTTHLMWLHHKARINLRTDVVPTQEDIGSSTFLVSAAWANRIVATCIQNGYLETIRVTKRSSRQGKRAA